MVENSRAERQERIKAIRSPAHARAFGAGADHRFAGGLGDAAAQMHPLSAKEGIAQAIGIAGKVVHGSFWTTACLTWLWREGRQGLEGSDAGFNLSFHKPRTGARRPGRGLCSAAPKDGVPPLPDMLLGVLEINDLHGLGKLFAHQVPNPRRAIP